MGIERLRKGAFFICFSLNKKIYAHNFVPVQYIFFFAISIVILQHNTGQYKKEKKLYKKAEKDFPDDYTYLLTKGWG